MAEAVLVETGEFRCAPFTKSRREYERQLNARLMRTLADYWDVQEIPMVEIEA